MLSERYNNFSKMIIYQVYPRSFFDGNGDGIGDFKGITEKADHLYELGVNAIWLCPCYKSPNVDNGYDVEDYYQTMDEFGTIEEWKQMQRALSERGIKIIMDLVPNHTSDKHKWFVESKKSRDNAYSDFYYWADEPLNDWRSCFGGSAWEYSAERGQYYLHSYAVGQPDLNFDNPKVREEIKKIIDFWVSLGVCGFRIDVIDQISKDFENKRNSFGPNLHKYINELFGREGLENIYTVGECWAKDIAEIKRHCAEERRELVSLFQFDHIDHGRNGRFESAPFTVEQIARDLDRWQSEFVKNDIIHTLFTDNHDQPRFISRFGNDTDLRYESATMFASMVYLLRGIPFIYQGQEFGMTNSYHSDFSEFRDVENIHYYNENYGKMPENELMARINFGSRDNARRPLAWSDAQYGGFSTALPWIDTYSRYKEINLESDKKSQRSVFEFYKKLLQFRKESDVVLFGDYRCVMLNDFAFAYEREKNGKKVLVVCNFDRESEINVGNFSGECVLSNYTKRDSVNGKYAPYETAVFSI